VGKGQDKKKEVKKPKGPKKEKKSKGITTAE
jgi:hypothetical protein